MASSTKKTSAKRSQCEPFRVLVVDDEAAMREVLELRLSSWGYRVFLAENGASACEVAQRVAPHVVLTDVQLPGCSGLEVLRTLQGNDPRRQIILMTAYGSIDTAVEAMKDGARDFLTKPLDYSRLRTLLDQAVQEVALERNTADSAASALDHGAGLGPLVGTSPPQQALYEVIKKVAGADASVLISGESGTGKELVARTIYQLSARRKGPFIAINAAAIPEGLTEGEMLGHCKGAFTSAVSDRAGFIEQADGGILFLDEFAEMPIGLQPKLLRVLEDQRVRRIGGRHEISCNVRVLAATNRDPQQAIESGLLRHDLFYRLNVFSIQLTPLRDRRSDIPLLVRYFIERFNEKHGTQVSGIRPQAMSRLETHPWPGNIRELANITERAVVLAQDRSIETLDLPPLEDQTSLVPSQTGGIRLPRHVTSAEAERILILETLKDTDNNKAETARRLGLDVKTIRNKLKDYEGAKAPSAPTRE